MFDYSALFYTALWMTLTNLDKSCVMLGKVVFVFNDYYKTQYPRYVLSYEKIHIKKSVLGSANQMHLINLSSAGRCDFSKCKCLEH